MIRNKWYCIESTYNSVINIPEYDKMNLTEKEQRRAEYIRRGGINSKTIIPALEKARMIASRFPPQFIYEKITPAWMLSKGGEKFPVLVTVLQGEDEAGADWLIKQCREICDFLTGKIYWSEDHRSMVAVQHDPER